MHARVEVAAVAARAGDCWVLPEETVAGVLDGPTDAPFTEGMTGVHHEVGAPDSDAVAPTQVGEARDGRGTAQRRGGRRDGGSRARGCWRMDGPNGPRPAGAGKEGSLASAKVQKLNLTTRFLLNKVQLRTRESDVKM